MILLLFMKSIILNSTFSFVLFELIYLLSNSIPFNLFSNNDVLMNLKEILRVISSSILSS